MRIPININYFKSEFTRNVITLITGTTVAQIIPVVLQLILRRLFTPEAFGAFAIYFSVIGIIVVISTLKYEMAIVLPEKDKDAANIFILSLFINLVFNFLILLILIFFRSFIVKFLNFPQQFAFWLYFIPLSAFLFSSYQIINYWLIRQKAFKASSLNKILRRSFEGITQIAFGFSGKSLGLVAGDIMGNIVNNIGGYFQIMLHGFSFKYFSLTKLKYVLRKYKQFPQFQAIPALMNTASLLLPFIIINKLYSGNITAQFDLSRMVLALPIALISVSFSQVLLQKLSEKRRRKEKILKHILKISLALFTLVIPGVIIIMLWGPDIFRLAFGLKWKEAGEFSQILVFTYAIQFVVSPLAVIFPALEKIKIAAVWQTAYFIIIVVLFLLRGLTVMEFITVYMYITLVVYFVYWIMITKVARNYDSSVSK